MKLHINIKHYEMMCIPLINVRNLFMLNIVLTLLNELNIEHFVQIMHSQYVSILLMCRE